MKRQMGTFNRSEMLKNDEKAEYFADLTNY